MVWGSVLHQEEEEMLTPQGHVAPTDQSISDGLQQQNLQNQTMNTREVGRSAKKQNRWILKEKVRGVKALYRGRWVIESQFCNHLCNACFWDKG